MYIFSNLLLAQVSNARDMNTLPNERLMSKCIINPKENEDTHPITFENQAPKVRVA